MYAIEATDLIKLFGKKVTLYHFSIRIPEGSIYGLLGPNGAGKSTFIRIIAGLEKHDSGVLKIFDKAPNNRLRKILGIAPQENSFHNLLTCFENLLYYAELYGIRKNYAEERANELLRMLGLEDKANSVAAWLSGGMKRRLNLACGIMHKPKIVILDEPTTGLDPISRMKMWDVIRYLRDKEKVTLILTTHYMEEAEALCDEISFVNKGRVIRTGTPEKLKFIVGKEFLKIKSKPGNYQKISNLIKSIPGVNHVSITEDDGGSLIIQAKNVATKISTINKIIIENREEIIDIRISKPTLEDAFIKLTGSALKGAKNETHI